MSLDPIKKSGLSEVYDPKNTDRTSKTDSKVMSFMEFLKMILAAIGCSFENADETSPLLTKEVVVLDDMPLKRQRSGSEASDPGSVSPELEVKSEEPTVVVEGIETPEYQEEKELTSFEKLVRKNKITKSDLIQILANRDGEVSEYSTEKYTDWDGVEKVVEENNIHNRNPLAIRAAISEFKNRRFDTQNKQKWAVNKEMSNEIRDARDEYVPFLPQVYAAKLSKNELIAILEHSGEKDILIPRGEPSLTRGVFSIIMKHNIHGKSRKVLEDSLAKYIEIRNGMKSQTDRVVKSPTLVDDKDFMPQPQTAPRSLSSSIDLGKFARVEPEAVLTESSTRGEAVAESSTREEVAAKEGRETSKITSQVSEVAFRARQSIRKLFGF